jgi:hypothetical protein
MGGFAELKRSKPAWSEKRCFVEKGLQERKLYRNDRIVRTSGPLRWQGLFPLAAVAAGSKRPVYNEG